VIWNLYSGRENVLPDGPLMTHRKTEIVENRPTAETSKLLEEELL
jgi:hypothetical protein